ncbi:UTP--glucose-1-phosphate uridylyltransferase GalU [Bacillus infantis]|uniref:UTP--glucose-1-phosphate uridylyltransferase GalU n=1 Tax=Bacillus infantis TaxID=324767 RepID=UPI0021552910|nr:UTP--glucose-1-phosphate uridylyltransferase GalU [Bacillus infantis]MCR6612957.1 UTP--glucose-1-phosphate uridylyltransferase GalU [Bacillus infantis]
MKKIKKAIIPAAGLGTRFLPATKAMPKEMLPIVDKPAIQYIVEEAVASGIEDVIIVTGKAKRAIEDHFDKNVELELKLMEQQKQELLEIARDTSNLVDIHYVRQKEPLGLGHAIWCARKFVGNDPFAVLLGDMIIDNPIPCLKQMMDVYQAKQCSVIGVEPVDWKDVSKYGVISGSEDSQGLYKVNYLVEKPKVNPPSNLAIVGRYILEPEIMDILGKISAGIGREIQLTDALQQLTSDQQIYGFQYEGKLYDIGSKLGFLKATVEFALANSEVKDDFQQYLSEISSPLIPL